MSHIKNALHIVKPKKVKLDKDLLIICYCSVGYRSANFANKLLKSGYSNVYNLKGSIFEWANKGQELYSDGNKVSKIHPFNKEWGQLLQKNNL
jgi:rhodanese-related sulfurtransferase